MRHKADFQRFALVFSQKLRFLTVWGIYSAFLVTFSSFSTENVPIFQFDRCRAIIGNLHRLGVNNAVVCNLGGEEFAKIRPNGFDRILLDAPCPGTGAIWKDQSLKTSKDSQDVQRRHTVQRQLILSALDSLDANSPNGGEY